MYVPEPRFVKTTKAKSNEEVTVNASLVKRIIKVNDDDYKLVFDDGLELHVCKEGASLVKGSDVI